MKYFLILLFILTPLLYAGPIQPEQVVVLYNSKVPESKKLANHYATARNIPTTNLIGLDLPDTAEISREDYNLSLRDPLNKTLIARRFKTMGTNPQGFSLPVATSISTLVCMRGIPYKIKRSPVTQPATQKLPPRLAKTTEASVDSELALSGITGPSIAGPLNNPYFKKDTHINEAGMPHILLVGRIDGPSYDICIRMINDAIATEKQGLWGMCYLDKSLKGANYTIGDQWLQSIAHLNDSTGIPTVMDSNKQTFTTNYPMSDAALYFGWYTPHRNGPLLNSNFNFRRGAIAVHLHSYSASNLRKPHSRWVGPILAKGAAATLGNVYEPYFPLIHHFDIFHDRLLKGYSLVEAAYMALPVLSWQNVVLGDPLYRPFIHLNGSGTVTAEDRDFRAIRVANQRWGKEPENLVKKLRSTAAEKNNARFYEYLGLWYAARNQPKIATAFFETSSKQHIKASDRLRQWIYIADLQRKAGNKKGAIATLKQARELTPNIPEVKSVVALLNILDPPPPPKVEPQSKTKKK